jgi:hypothetical protein
LAAFFVAVNVRSWNVPFHEMKQRIRQRTMGDDTDQKVLNSERLIKIQRRR